MSKRLKTGKSKTHSAAKTVVRESRSIAASALGYRKTKDVSVVVKGHRSGVQGVSIERVHNAPAVAVQVRRRADPSLLDPYDWGPEGVPKGKPLGYVPGRGFVVED